MKINPKGTTALKKDVLADISEHQKYAILSSRGEQDLSIALVIEDSTELYQISTIAGSPLKKGTEKAVATKFYYEQLGAVASMLQSVEVQTLILDYNLSFWAYVPNENLATFLIREVGAKTVWTGVKTRVTKDEVLTEKAEWNSLPHTLSKSGAIALSLLKSYAPERLENFVIFNEDLTKAIEKEFEKKPQLLRASVKASDVFDVKKDKENAEEIETLEWALKQAKAIRNPVYEKVLERLLNKSKKPIFSQKKSKRTIVPTRRTK
jgi:DNA-binding TFAR19-related protein (PDSD5 family)